MEPKDDLDLESLEISDFLDETSLSDAEDLANVMAASSTTCECCCSISTAVAIDSFAIPNPADARRDLFRGRLRAQVDRQGTRISATELRSIESEWPKLIAEVRQHQERGTDPQDPAVQRLAQRWQELTEKFTGGSNAVARAAAKLYANHDNAIEDLFGENLVPDVDTAAYVAAALRR